MAGTNWVELAKYVLRARPDISASVTHWTRSQGSNSGFQNLIKIIGDEKIIVSNTQTGFIKGRFPATCFSEAPVAVMARVFRTIDFDPNAKKYINYEPYGLSFIKPVIYGSFGGRPVINFSQDEYNTYVIGKGLESEIGWRVVAFDHRDIGGVVDWTHEREWRVKGDVDFSLLKGGAEKTIRPLAVVARLEEEAELAKLFPDGEHCPIRGIINLQSLLIG